MAVLRQEAICLALRMTGIPWLLREVYARRKVTIVNYHDPAPDVFAAHMEYFSRKYSFVGIDEVAEALERRDFSGLPPKPLLVTLDDGHAGNAELFGILAQYKVRATIYAVAGVVGTKRGFWFDVLPHDSELVRRFVSMPDQHRRRVLAEEYGHTDQREYEEPQALSVSDLREFLRIGGTVGSHTMFHPILDRCAGAVRRYECEESRRVLEGMVGVAVKHFALPRGCGGAEVRPSLKQAGYVTCRTTTEGWVTPRSDSLALPNFGIADDAGLHKAAVQASGLLHMLNLIRRAFAPR